MCALLFVSCAQNRPSLDPAESTNSLDAKKHFLWKVSDENSSVWVLGSIHFADSSFYPLDSVIENAFESADEFALEINVGDDSVSNEIASESTKQGFLPDGETLKDVLPESTWESFDSICVAWGVPSDNFMKFRPWLAATTLSSVAIQRSGIDPNLGIDVVLLDRASSEGKAIVGLETVSEQVGAVADTNDSDASGVYYLQTTLREISELDSMVTRIVRAWKNGDDALLRQVMGDSDDDSCDGSDDDCSSEAAEGFRKNLEEKIYTTRNGKMAQKIASFLEEDRNVFVVVGAAHLALDKDSVIDLLKAKGFVVQRY